ncbi:unnamed protein product [Microthlaspi erraticum]|uniref:Zinc finger PHD-type domain-containing protein n=1 Tax=Microthlaspi erraticum TaxID=1685480 RepID=A0A6D2HRI5_9BRAS|nr:unnamed protein product [Microthlaspi erraticum]
MSHDFHPEHPLELCLGEEDDDGETRYMVCSGCGNMFIGSRYECKKCEIYLDLGCALMENIFRCWDATEKFHDSHCHILRRCRPGPNANVSSSSCLLCELPLSPSAICYGCVHCYLFFHERCLHLPTEIQHPVQFTNLMNTKCSVELLLMIARVLEKTVHVTVKKRLHIHPLRCKTFIAGSSATEYCGVCETIIHTEHRVYSCKECDFLGHVECCLRKVNGEEHIHVMIPCKMSELLEQAKCDICGGEICSSPCKCETCSFQSHHFCAELGWPSIHEFHPNHPLTLLPCPPTYQAVECGICSKEISDFNLFCHVCNFIIHISCVLKGSYTFFCAVCEKMLSGRIVSCMACGDLYHPRCIQVERKDIHNHPIHCCYILSLSIASGGSKCLVCKENIAKYSYECHTCKASFHLKCIEEAASGSRAGGFHQHNLYNYWEEDSTRECSVCARPCGKSFYGCVSSDCNFCGHVECVGFPWDVKSQLHRHAVTDSFPDSEDQRCSLYGSSYDAAGIYTCNHCEDTFHLT